MPNWTEEKYMGSSWRGSARKKPLAKNWKVCKGPPYAKKIRNRQQGAETPIYEQRYQGCFITKNTNGNIFL